MAGVVEEEHVLLVGLGDVGVFLECREQLVPARLIQHGDLIRRKPAQLLDDLLEPVGVLLGVAQRRQLGAAVV